VLLQVGLLGLQRRDLLLQLCVLAFLAAVAFLHFIFRACHLLRERFPDVASFAGQHVLKRFLLRAESLNFLLIEIEFLVHAFDGFLESVDLSFEGGRVGGGVDALGVH